MEATKEEHKEYNKCMELSDCLKPHAECIKYCHNSQIDSKQYWLFSLLKSFLTRPFSKQTLAHCLLYVPSI